MWRYASHHDGRFIEDDDHDDTVKPHLPFWPVLSAMLRSKLLTEWSRIAVCRITP